MLHVGRRIQTGSLRSWRVKSKRRGGCTAVTLSSSVRRWLVVRHATYQIGGEGEVEVRASVHVGENAPRRRNMGVSGVHQHSFLSTHTATVLTCKSISTLESIRQEKKEMPILPFRQTAAPCPDTPHPKRLLLIPPFFSFFIFLSHSPLLPHFTSVNTLPLSSSQATALPLRPTPPPPPV